MPLPVLVWLGAAAIIATAGAIQANDARNRYNAAQDRYAKRRRLYETAVGDLEKKHDQARDRFEEFGKTRLKAAVALGEAVKFLDRAKVKDRDLLGRLHIPEQTLREWKTVSVQAADVLSGIATSLQAGAASAAGAYALVGTLAAASTGTAIAALSGAAATNATLAWLGGGAIAAGGGGMAAGTVVLGGLVIAPAVLVAGLFANMKVGEIETMLEAEIAKLDTDEAEKQRAAAALGVLMARVVELDHSTFSLTNELYRLIANTDPDDVQNAHMVWSTAKSLANILDVAVLDREGKPL